MNSTEDYNSIMSDHNLFNNFVYTPLPEALRLLEERQKDPALIAKIEKLLNGDIPEVLKNKKCGVLGRHIATPNYESRVFIDVSIENNLYPVFFEYHEDKFISNNNYKHSLGQLYIEEEGFHRNVKCLERVTIVDFNTYNGKKLCEVNTLWNEPLVDFHRRLFSLFDYPNESMCFFNGSNWCQKNGKGVKDFYRHFFLLFILHGIVFENFLISQDSEGEFTRNIVLPAIHEIINLTGLKPLIVPIPPMDMENDNFWYHHLSKVKTLL